MKRGLLTTSALIAVGLYTFPASAQRAPVSVTVGGYLGDLVGYLGQGQAGGAESAAPVDPASEAEAQPPGQAGLDHGMTIGFRPELAASTGSEPGEESVMFIDGRFGRIELGTLNDLGPRTPFRAPDALARAWVADGRFQSWTSNPGAITLGRSALGTSRLRAEEGDAGRVSYLTPRFKGFEFGVTYMPDVAPGNAIARNTADLAVIGGTGPQGGFTAGANFVRDFGGVNVMASLGYSQWNLSDGSASSNPDAIGASLVLGYGDFKLGGSWARTSGGRAEATGIAATPSFATATRLDGRVFEIGASYSIGAAAFSVTYFDGRVYESPASGPDRGDDKLTGVALSGNYRLGSGINLDAVLFHSRYRGNASDTPRNDSKSTGFVTGLVLQF